MLTVTTVGVVVHYKQVVSQVCDRCATCHWHVTHSDMSRTCLSLQPGREPGWLRTRVASSRPDATRSATSPCLQWKLAFNYWTGWSVYILAEFIIQGV